MHLEEYYPTRTEFAILDKHKSVLREIFEEDGLPVDLIEFGAGDGLKTRLLLEEMLNEGTDFRYTPIDISEDALEWLSQSLLTDFPSLEIKTMHDDYFRALDKLHDETGWREVVLFLGSNLGNFDLEGSLTFLGEIRARLNPGDYLFIGLDLKKDPNRILKAYNDAQGVTREFNMNLLRRMNRELNANFNLDKFLHYPTYEPITGEMKSYLISAEEQEVYFELMDFTVQFGAWECIHTETSWKYELGEIEQMAAGDWDLRLEGILGMKMEIL